MRLGVAAAVVDGVLVPGDVEIADGEIAAVGLASAGSGLAIPGLVDLQVNGYAGVDVLNADTEAIVQMEEAIARDGVLAYQPTLITSPAEVTREALRVIDAAASDGRWVRIVGAHLEGPFLSSERAGAHPPALLLEPDLALLASLLDAGCAVTTVTLAPELPGAGELIDFLISRGVVVSLGHTNATAGEAHAAFDRGAGTVTHLYNAMRPFRHRDPGIVGAALARDDVIVQLIADGEHVAQDAILAAWRAARGRIAFVSDAIVATSLGDGVYSFGERKVTVANGISRLADGTLAGAVRPLAWGLRVLVELGVPIVEAVAAVTSTPATLLRRPDLGRLARGERADVVVLDDDLAVTRVLVGGIEL